MSYLRMAITMAVLPVAGCPVSSSASAADDLRQGVEQMVAADCAWYYRCGYVSDEAACRTRLLGDTSSSSFDRYAEHVTVDLDRLAACAALYRTGTCDLVTAQAEYFHRLETCRGIFTGDLADGATCVDGVECASGSCSTCEGACCTGICVPKPGLPSGDTCTGLGLGFNEECAAGTVCARTDGHYSCKPPAAEGAACTWSAECAEGLACVTDLTALPGVCLTPLAAGQTCAPRLWLECDTGLYCDSSTQRCTALAAPGQACDVSTYSCMGFATCAHGLCVALPTEGEACSDTTGCELGFECTAGTCTRPSICP